MTGLIKTIAFDRKVLIDLGDFIEGVFLIEQRRGIQLSFGDQLHQISILAGVYAAGFPGEVLAIHAGQGQNLIFLVHGEEEMTALGRAIFQASWKVPSLPAGLDNGVGAAAFGQLL